MDDILNALAVSNIPTTTTLSKLSPGPIHVYDGREELRKTITHLDELIESNRDALEEAKMRLKTTGEPEFFEVFAAIGKAQSEALKNKVKIIVDTEKTVSTHSLKTRELNIKEKLADFAVGDAAEVQGQSVIQNNVIMTGSREEMFDMIRQMKEHDESTVISIDGQIISD